MNEFENKLILKEEEYQNSFFPKVPKASKRGSAFILTGGCSDDIVVDDYTTSKQIRQGKYTHLVEISTSPYLKEIKFQSPSKDTHFEFEVYVKAVIQVNDPIVFYANKNLDVDAYFDNRFSLDVRKITRKYSVLKYAGMDEELTEKLSSYNTIDAATGFSYQISVVDAMPGENAKEYVYELGKQQLDAEIRENAKGLAKGLSYTYEEAVMTEVAEGKLSETEAILKIDQYRSMNYEEKVNFLNKLKKEDYFTDTELKGMVFSALEQFGMNSQTQLGDVAKIKGNDRVLLDMNAFYEDGGE